MSNTLLENARNGDVESQFKLGQAYMFGEEGFSVNPSEAIPWLEKAGGTYPQALRMLIGISLGYPDASTRSADRLIKSFERMISEHNRIDAMVTLGAIFCGDPDNNEHIIKLPELAKPPYYNREKGYNMIFEGISQADKMDKNPLGFMEYETAYTAIQFGITHSGRGSQYFHNSDIDTSDVLTIKTYCARMALEMLKAGKGTSRYLPEQVKQLITMYEKIAG